MKFCYVLVFFDDILIYSANLKEHHGHLEQVLIILRLHELYAKRSKCTFAVDHVDYLGYIISGEGVATDPEKVKSMLDWPIPKTLKQLGGFVGLTIYYRRFIANYGVIAKSLTDLTRKGAFKWNETVEQAFHSLKQQMVTAPVLALPDFTKQLIIETDACQYGIGAVLMQDQRPIAFFSQALCPRNQALSTYERSS